MASVTINLSESSEAKGLKPESVIHQSQFNKTIDLIRQGVQKAVARKDATDEHIHEAITILGTRGSGKTTFLLSIKDYIERTENKQVKVLEIIDPTIIEDKGHIFLNIISIINELVQEKLTDSNIDSEFQLKDWNHTLFDLAHGLPSMDGVGGTLNEADWQDAEFIMEKGLVSVASARKLSESFQEYVRKALKILNKEVFLLMFDDIDIDFKKGWSILETVRKYLHTSKIITLLSGDLNLYKLAIRNKYWNNFGKGMMINEGDRMRKNEYFNDRITELESQYLLKIIKPERRIHLTTLYEKIMVGSSLDHSTESPVNLLINNTEISIQSYYTDILAAFGIKNKYQSEAYSSFLLALPLRSQIQFLSQFGNDFSNIMTANVTDAFLSDLIDNNVNLYLINANPQLINVEILNLLLKKKALNDLYQLQPVTRDSGLNSCLVALSLLSTQKISSNPYLIFDYFIKIGYVRNLIGLLGYEDEPGKSLANLSPSIEGLCNYSGIFQNKVLRDIVGNMTSYIKGEAKVNNWAGIISLSGLGDTSKKGANVTSDRIDIVLRNANPDQRIVGFMPLSICSFTTINRSIPCYSVYTLLATIGELIRKADQRDLSRGLAELSEVRTYGIPEFKKRVSDRVEMIPFLSETAQGEPFMGYELKKNIGRWVEKFNELSLEISPHILGKIATRFFYALNSIENIEETNQLGTMMHTRVIALLNAILIEDVRENIEDIDGFNINNTNLSESIFLNNLRNTSNHYMKLQFSQWLISCPLLLLYLDFKPQLVEPLSFFLSLTSEEWLFYRNNSVFFLLQKVTAKTNKQNRNVGGRRDYDNIIETLKERNIPFAWFELTDDKKATREYNESIRNNLSNLFGKNATPTSLRNFRKYLRDTRQQW
jgi:hypothetical protein